MLLGKYNHSLDAKKRIIIPAKIKEQLTETVVILKSPTDQCLRIYSTEEWANYDKKLAELPQTRTKDFRRFLYQSAMEYTPDAQGRIQLPETMLTYADITKEVVTVGVSTYVEIWAKEVWDRNNLDDKPEDLVALLEELGL